MIHHERRVYSETYVGLDENWEIWRTSEKVDKKSKELNRHIANRTERKFTSHVLEMKDQRENL